MNNLNIKAFHIAFSGFLALVVVMGIGRFTFTPQVPLMIDESQLTLTSASIVAAFNYLGYLAGSYDATKAVKGVGYHLWGGLWGSVIITLLSAFLNNAFTHSIARFFIGWASGWALVLVASWANERLAQLNRPALSAAVYAGGRGHIYQRYSCCVDYEITNERNGGLVDLWLPCFYLCNICKLSSS